MTGNNIIYSDIHINEIELITLLKDGDSKGFAYLYKNYGKALFNEIKSVIADHAIASDVLQELFINIYRKIATYDTNKGKLYTWMMAMARNLAIDTCLSKGYRNYQQNTSLSAVSEKPSLHSETWMDNIGLHHHIKKIEAKYWDVLYLRYFQGNTYEEIALLLAMPLGTVKTRMKAGLVQLRKLMNE